MHNIPEGIAIAVPIYYSSKKRFKSLLFLIVSSLGEVIGAIISLFILKNKINSIFIGYILISISILMILIAIEEIFPKIINKNKTNIFIGIIIGIILFIISLFIYC